MNNSKERTRRTTNNIIAAAYGEGHAVPSEVGVVGVKADIGGRVVTLCVPVMACEPRMHDKTFRKKVHGVRAIAVRSWEANV